MNEFFNLIKTLATGIGSLGGLLYLINEIMKLKNNIKKHKFTSKMRKNCVNILSSFFKDNVKNNEMVLNINENDFYYYEKIFVDCKFLTFHKYKNCYTCRVIALDIKSTIKSLIKDINDGQYDAKF